MSTTKKDFYESSTATTGYDFPSYKRPPTTRGGGGRRPPTETPGPPTSTVGRKSVPPAERSVIDPTSADRIWTEIVNNEKRGHRIRETQWGFLAEFDHKGHPRTPVELPTEPVSYYSKVVPNTDSRQYGSRVSTPLGHTLQSLEHRFYSANRRNRLGSEFVCY